MAEFLRNCELTAKKALSVARDHKAVVLLPEHTVGKHTLSAQRVVFVDYRMDGFISTNPYDACVVVV